MNFKYFIGIVYISFVALVMVMVFKSCAQKNELETVNYYAEELQYQSRIDAKMKGNEYKDSFRVYAKENFIKITQPIGLIADSSVLEFRKPDNAADDVDFHFMGQKFGALSKNKFKSGVYNLSIRVFTGEGEYLIEKNIRL